MTLIDGDMVIYSMTASILPGPGRRRGDFMATVKVTEAKQLEAEYRFRWWNTVNKLDMDGGADDDEKSFFEIHAGADCPESREKLMRGFRALAAGTPGFAHVHEDVGEWTLEQFVLDVMQRGPMRTQLTREELP